jgi:hypothetical protein
VHAVRMCSTEMPLVPERRSIDQREKDILYTGPRVAVFLPAEFNGSPQFLAESQAPRPLRFLRSNPLQDFIDDHDIRLDLDVGVVSAQDLGRHRLTGINYESIHGNTYFVDEHPESVTIGLSCWSVAF